VINFQTTGNTLRRTVAASILMKRCVLTLPSRNLSTTSTCKRSFSGARFQVSKPKKKADLTVSGIIKDYFVVSSTHEGRKKHFWASSSSWTFSELPNALTNQQDLAKIAQINNFFTGEFDSVLFASSGKAECIDAELGVYMQPKPITELDRLVFVIGRISERAVAPRGWAKIVPNGSV
jgi:hypothetical protein